MVRDVVPEDASQFVKWVLQTPSNNFDPGIGTYPLLRTLVCEDATGPLLYVPMHAVISLESVAVRPGITGRQYIKGLTEISEVVDNLARNTGVREIYTTSTYDPMIKTLRRHDYDTPQGTLFRKKIR